MIKQTDRELLELVALAAGLTVSWWDERGAFLNTSTLEMWNPLTDDGDCFRLAVKLQINQNWRININGTFVYANNEPEDAVLDPYAAARRAIVCAAAEIGQSIQGVI